MKTFSVCKNAAVVLFSVAQAVSVQSLFSSDLYEKPLTDEIIGAALDGVAAVFSELANLQDFFRRRVKETTLPNGEKTFFTSNSALEELSSNFPPKLNKLLDSEIVQLGVVAEIVHDVCAVDLEPPLDALSDEMKELSYYLESLTLVEPDGVTILLSEIRGKLERAVSSIFSLKKSIEELSIALRSAHIIESENDSYNEPFSPSTEPGLLVDEAIKATKQLLDTLSLLGSLLESDEPLSKEVEEVLGSVAKAALDQTLEFKRAILSVIPLDEMTEFFVDTLNKYVSAIIGEGEDAYRKVDLLISVKNLLDPESESSVVRRIGRILRQLEKEQVRITERHHTSPREEGFSGSLPQESSTKNLIEETDTSFSESETESTSESTSGSDSSDDDIVFFHNISEPHGLL